METAVSELRVASRKRRLLVATDGEVTPMETPLEFRIVPRALEVLVPAEDWCAHRLSDLHFGRVDPAALRAAARAA